MPIVSVRAVYDKGEVRLLEKPPVQDRYEVLVTFLAPKVSPVPAAGKRTLKDLKGIWSDIDLSLEDIQAHEYRTPEDLL
jgi:hypothetical protein